MKGILLPLASFSPRFQRRKKRLSVYISQSLHICLPRGFTAHVGGYPLGNSLAMIIIHNSLRTFACHHSHRPSLSLHSSSSSSIVLLTYIGQVQPILRSSLINTWCTLHMPAQVDNLEKWCESNILLNVSLRFYTDQ